MLIVLQDRLYFKPDSVNCIFGKPIPPTMEYFFIAAILHLHIHEGLKQLK